MHLSSLGFPIANDSQYGGSYKGPDQVRTHAAVIRREQQPQLGCQSGVVVAAHTSIQAVVDKTGLTGQEPLSGQSANKRQKCSASATTSWDQTDDSCGQLQVDEDTPGSHKPEQTMAENTQANRQIPEANSTCSAEFLVPQDLQDDMCLNCPNLIPPGYPTDIHPLWLHAQSYTCDQWSFVCPKPEWASPTWVPPAEQVSGKGMGEPRG